MATATAFSTLAVPPPDEHMEMSSPANRLLDEEDIDIDFDDYAGDVPTGDDDHMLEDADTRHGMNTDDMMEDDPFTADQASVAEEVMRDDAIPPPVEEDEELIDYGEDDFHDEATEETFTSLPVEEAPPATASSMAEVDEDISQSLEVAGEETAATAVIDEGHAGVTLEEAPLTSAANADGAVSLEPTAEEHDVAATESVYEFDETHHDDESARSALLVDTTLTAEDNTPGTPTDTGLHPMTCRYGDMVMPLFKSKRQPAGLLKDDNLANLSLAELIQNCRERLATKIGDDIGEDQEVVLSFDHFGLMLVEDTRAAFESSLNDVLEVYLQLYRNDGVDEAPPLSLTLSLQLKFASSLTMFKEAAAGGQGMSHFSFLQPAGEEDVVYGEYHDEGAAELHGEEEEPNEGEFDETAVAHGETEDDPLQNTGDANGQDEQEDHEEADYYHEDGEGETYDDQDGEQPPPGFEQLLQGEAAPSPHEAYNAPQDPGASNEDAGPTASTAVASAGPLETDQPAPKAAGSSTLQAETGLDNTDPSADDQDDFSTFLTEFDEDDQAVKEVNVDHDNSNAEASISVGLVSDEAAHTQLGTDLDEFGEQNYEGHDSVEHDADFDEQDPGDELARQEEGQDYDQADTHDEQHHDASHELDFQFGEEDEQYDDSQNYQNGDGYEHGLEHGLEDDEGLDDSVDTVVHHTVDDAPAEDALVDFDDEEFDFGEDTTEQHEEDATAPSATPGSLRGKRSFDEQADAEDFGDNERELKKARAG